MRSRHVENTPQPVASKTREIPRRLYIIVLAPPAVKPFEEESVYVKLWTCLPLITHLSPPLAISSVALYYIITPFVNERRRRRRDIRHRSHRISTGGGAAGRKRDRDVVNRRTGPPPPPPQPLCLCHPEGRAAVEERLSTGRREESV
ncbi:hypothetical protein QTP88_007775 [Uroleucon formosanum]